MFPDFYFSKFYFEVAVSANTSSQKHFRKTSSDTSFTLDNPNFEVSVEEIPVFWHEKAYFG